jgi:YVTN family beta-propeller protein
MKRKKIIWSGVVFVALIVGIGISVYLAPKATIRLRCINWHEKILPGLKPNRDYVFVAMGVCNSVLGSDTLTVVDAEAGVILKTIKVGHHPMAPAITPDGRWLYVSNIDSGTVSVIDVERPEVVKEIVTKGTPQHLAMDRGGRRQFSQSITDGASYGDADLWLKECGAA